MAGLTYKTVKFGLTEYALLYRLAKLRSDERGTTITVPAAVTEAVKIVLDELENKR